MLNLRYEPQQLITLTWSGKRKERRVFQAEETTGDRTLCLYVARIKSKLKGLQARSEGRTK